MSAVHAIIKTRRKNLMRRKSKLFCDECGSFIREVTIEEAEQIKKDKAEGTRTNLEIICRSCLIK